MRNPMFNPKLVSSCALILSLTIVRVAIAAYNPPPDQQPPSDYSRTSGTRGCPQDKIPLTVLAPKKYVGHTASVYPTFAWFISNPYQVEFRLFELDPKNEPKLVTKPILIDSAPGINKYSLPKEQPQLTVGKKYFWQVSIRCEQTDLIEAADFTVVQIRMDVSQKLKTAKDGLEKAKIYAEAGLWYDSLAEALNSPNQPELQKLVSTLLQNLAKSEEPGVKEENRKRIDNLKQIITVVLKR
jgi:hypothetical protein